MELNERTDMNQSEPLTIILPEELVPMILFPLNHLSTHPPMKKDKPKPVTERTFNFSEKHELEYHMQLSRWADEEMRKRHEQGLPQPPLWTDEEVVEKTFTVGEMHPRTA